MTVCYNFSLPATTSFFHLITNSNIRPHLETYYLDYLTMTEAPRPKVGVGAIIHDTAGNVVMGERAGSHGAGTLQLPGGHLEHGESFADTAAREVLEETGLEVGNVKFLTATNDIFEEGGHYVTVFVTCTIVGVEKVPKVCVCVCGAWSC
jgi:8-oxo-dGTP diphosphatase